MAKRFYQFIFHPGHGNAANAHLPCRGEVYSFAIEFYFLQFIWSLEDPYDQIEVQVIIGGTTTVYTYQGNTGMVIQPFTNPATDGNVDITVKARCICNPDAVPVEYGAFTTTTLS